LVGGNLNYAQCTYFVNYIEEFGSVIIGPNAHDPVDGYHKYIDVDSWIDGYILDLFVKDPDALRLSHYFSKPRYGKLYNDIAWDYDRTMGSTDGRDLNPCGNIGYMPTFNPTGNNSGWFDIWEQLFEDIDFYVRFADRWYDLRIHGPMNTDYMFPVIDGFAGQITPEIYARELARWDTPANTNYGPRNSSPAGCAPAFGQTINTYELEVDFFKWWLNRRMEWISDTHLNLHPPAVSVVGTTAVITPAPSAPVGSTLYLTLDGTDPRLPGGGLSPNAIPYSGPAALNQSTWVYARTYDPSQIIERRWSAMGKAYYQASPAADFTNLAISEIHYNPADDPDNDFEYLELTNTSPVRIDISGVQIRTAISHTFGVGHLDPGEMIVVAKDFNAIQYRYDTPTSPWYYAGIRYEEWASGSLANDGELIELFAADNSPILSFTYRPSGAWPARANGGGSALELGDPTAVPTTTLEAKNIYLADGDNWRPTSEYHGSPGRAGLGPDGRALFNELLTHTDLPQTDTIELFNTTADPLNLSHWFLSDSGNEYKKFQIADGTTVGAGGFITFDETDFNSGNPNNPIPFALSSSEGKPSICSRRIAAATCSVLWMSEIWPHGQRGQPRPLPRWPRGFGAPVRPHPRRTQRPLLLRPCRHQRNPIQPRWPRCQPRVHRVAQHGNHHRKPRQLATARRGGCQLWRERHHRPRPIPPPRRLRPQRHAPAQCVPHHLQPHPRQCHPDGAVDGWSTQQRRRTNHPAPPRYVASTACAGLLPHAGGR
jgi:hypothetical protein